jgi:hypothetical protein
MRMRVWSFIGAISMRSRRVSTARACLRRMWARLRRFLPDAQIMFTMTPLFGQSWTYDEMFDA